TSGQAHGESRKRDQPKECGGQRLYYRHALTVRSTVRHRPLSSRHRNEALRGDSGRPCERFDDDNARKGYCLYQLGCKGPATFSPCSTLEWNLGQSFPIKAGHPCLGCTERHFFDRMTPFYKRLPDIVVPGMGVEYSANVLGAAAVAASVGGVAVHATATVIAKQRKKKAKPESVPLAVFGETKKDTEKTGKESGEH
ncbi:MAG TPA: hypothetical protein VK187_04615, partial [Geobacteraceae bacterium]|nr:hypothetical protein [Geobacteraceae bacterium]